MCPLFPAWFTAGLPGTDAVGGCYRPILPRVPSIPTAAKMVMGAPWLLGLGLLFSCGSSGSTTTTEDSSPPEDTSQRLDSDVGLDSGDTGEVPPVDGDADGFDEMEDCHDCDDTNAAIHPGATEVCDDIDIDCNDDLDDDDIGIDYTDSDGDGFGDEDDLGAHSCDQPASTSANDYN